MTPAEAYFDAWNRHDAAAIVATFAEGGVYQDPASHGPLTGPAIGAYAAALWSAFPDLAFEISTITESAEGPIAAQWVMTGTNSAPFMGLPPSGKSVRLIGADFINVAEGKIQSVIGYFDSAELPRQLGLQVIVQPDAIGPFKFGVASHVSSGKTTKPGAFSVTYLHARSPEAGKKVSEYSQRIVPEMLAMPDFIGFIGVAVGTGMLTFSAWESAEGPRKLMSQGTHTAAARDFFSTDLANGGFTSVWSPVRINPMWLHCEACGKKQDAEKANGKCACGAVLPAPPAYF